MKKVYINTTKYYLTLKIKKFVMYEGQNKPGGILIIGTTQNILHVIDNIRTLK